MQARRAARELALILFSQFDKKITQYNQTEFEDIVLKSVRTLTNNSAEELKVSLGALYAMKEKIENDEMINIADKVVLALEIAEMTALEHTGDVKSYVFEIANAYKEHNIEIDNLIKKFAHGWDIDRLVKIDKDILRISIAEIMYIEGTPVKVVIDEALELAKKYSTDDSSSFINGILGKVVEEKKAIS